MAKASITLQKEVPAVIETPAGLVTVTCHSGKRVTVEYPGMLSVVRKSSMDIDGKFLSVVDGKAKPKFKLLTPITDGDGLLVGLEEPGVFQVGEVQ